MENPAQKSYQLYIDGQWVDASDGGTLDVFCPANGEQLSTIADATKDDVDRAVHAGAVSAGGRKENAAASLSVGGGQGGLGAGSQVDVFIHASTLAPGGESVRGGVGITHCHLRNEAWARPRCRLPTRLWAGTQTGAACGILWE